MSRGMCVTEGETEAMGMSRRHAGSPVSGAQPSADVPGRVAGSLPCFFVDPADVGDGRAWLRGAEARHCAVVRRLGPGREVVLLDGQGRRYHAAIAAAGPVEVAVRLLAAMEEALPVGPGLILGLSLLKGDSMDLVLEKLTELGVDGVVPLVSEHCENRGARGPRQRDRWQRVLQAGCKQCGRARLPVLHEIHTLPEFLALPLVRDAAARVLCQERRAEPAFAPWRDSPPREGPAIVLLGPEGGFSPAEQEAAAGVGFVPVSLGPLVLRAETAAIVAASLGLLLLGRLDPPAAERGTGPCGR